MNLFTFWSFSPLTRLERACLRSMLVAGHTVDLYTYDSLAAPPGIVVRDAADVLPRQRVVFNRRRGSSAPFSDVFRVAGLRRGLGTWVDADVLLLRSIADMGELIFGWAEWGLVNGAVLRLPPDNPYIDAIERLASARVPLPSHWSRWKKLRQLARGAIGWQRGLADLRVGALGPNELTAVLDKAGLLPYAQPAEVFYPVACSKAVLLLDPTARPEDRIVPATRAVHLWNSALPAEQKERPPDGSFLARIYERFG